MPGADIIQRIRSNGKFKEDQFVRALFLVLYLPFRLQDRVFSFIDGFHIGFTAIPFTFRPPIIQDRIRSRLDQITEWIFLGGLKGRLYPENKYFVRLNVDYPDILGITATFQLFQALNEVAVKCSLPGWDRIAIPQLIQSSSRLSGST